MNILIVNQSVIDLCASFFTTLTASVEVDGTHMSRSSIYDQFVCRTWLTRAPLWAFLVASTYGIVLAALERYTAVIHPIWYKVRAGSFYPCDAVLAQYCCAPVCMCVSIWVSSCSYKWRGATVSKWLQGQSWFWRRYVPRLILYADTHLPSFVAWAFRNKMGYRYLCVRINSVSDASISCRSFMNFGPVTPELTELICERLYDTAKKLPEVENIISIASN